MEDVENDDTTRDRPVPGESIRGFSSTMDEEDAELVYDHTRFQRDKVRCHYFHHYHGCRIIVERGAITKEFDERAPRVRVVLDAKGWTNMAEDHHPAIEEIVLEFYVNIH